MSDLIADSPALEWAAGQSIDFELTPLTLKSGAVLADYGTFTLVVREDPRWPRQGADLDAPVDPSGDGWAVAVTATGTPATDKVTFSFAAPAGPGRRRYVMDVRSDGGTQGKVSWLDATWVSIRPEVG